MKFLESIIRAKRREVNRKLEKMPVVELQAQPNFTRPCVSLVQSLVSKEKISVISEFKRASPSMGSINSQVSVTDVVQGYSELGVAGISILTDSHFDGSVDDIKCIRAMVETPILRKDFIIDPYQVYESRAIGADVILLISECLTSKQMDHLVSLAHELDLEVLVEMHHPDQLGKIPALADIIGYNNRDLVSFRIDVNRSLKYIADLPEGKPLIAESGIHDARIASSLLNAGYDGLLIGTLFMQSGDPVDACREFTSKLEEYSTKTTD
jgi:indole-3-glycerol phosphate synthase